jgi:hypothetical protein
MGDSEINVDGETCSKTDNIGHKEREGITILKWIYGNIFFRCEMDKDN